MILEQLAHQLGCAGRIRFVIEYYTVVNVAHTFSVVVDHDHGFSPPCTVARTFQKMAFTCVSTITSSVFSSMHFSASSGSIKSSPQPARAEFLNEVCREALALVDHHGRRVCRTASAEAQHTDGGTPTASKSDARVAHDQHVFRSVPSDP